MGRMIGRVWRRIELSVTTFVVVTLVSVNSFLTRSRPKPPMTVWTAIPAPSPRCRIIPRPCSASSGRTGSGAMSATASFRDYAGIDSGMPGPADRAHGWLQNPDNNETRNRNYLKDEIAVRIARLDSSFVAHPRGYVDRRLSLDQPRAPARLAGAQRAPALLSRIRYAR